MLTVYLVRHGQTDFGIERRYAGSTDVPITGEGRRQIVLVSEWLKRTSTRPDEASISAVYSSPLLRARHSGAIIADRFGLKVTDVPGFRERAFGLWEGRTFQELSESYPEDAREYLENPTVFTPPGGEPVRELFMRTARAFESIVKEHEKSPGFGDDAIVITAHGGVNRALLLMALGAPMESFFSLAQDFACVNIIQCAEDTKKVCLLNGVFWSQPIA